MRAFTLSELNRTPGDLVDLALASPIVLTKHGRRKIVMLSMDAYDDLVTRAAEGDALRSAVPKRHSLSALTSGLSNEEV